MRPASLRRLATTSRVFLAFAFVYTSSAQAENWIVVAAGNDGMQVALDADTIVSADPVSQAKVQTELGTTAPTDGPARVVQLWRVRCKENTVSIGSEQQFDEARDSKQVDVAPSGLGVFEPIEDGSAGQVVKARICPAERG